MPRKDHPDPMEDALRNAGADSKLARYITEQWRQEYRPYTWLAFGSYLKQFNILDFFVQQHTGHSDLFACMSEYRHPETSQHDAREILDVARTEDQEAAPVGRPASLNEGRGRSRQGKSASRRVEACSTRHSMCAHATASVASRRTPSPRDRFEDKASASQSRQTQQSERCGSLRQPATRRGASQPSIGIRIATIASLPRRDPELLGPGAAVDAHSERCGGSARHCSHVDMARRILPGGTY